MHWCEYILAQNLFLFEHSNEHSKIISLAEQLPAHVHFNSRGNLVNIFLSPVESDFVLIGSEHIVLIEEELIPSISCILQTLAKIFSKFLKFNASSDYVIHITDTQMIRPGNMSGMRSLQ